jgi:hypothetical protein
VVEDLIRNKFAGTICSQRYAGNFSRKASNFGYLKVSLDACEKISSELIVIQIFWLLAAISKSL